MRDAPLAQQPLDHLRVVQHLVAAAEVGVLVGEGVEAVRAGGDDLAHTVLLEHVDVLPSALLEEVLVADAAGRVAGALLLGAQDGEVDPRGLEDLHQRRRDGASAVVERRGAAHPVQVLGAGLVGREGDAEVTRPVGARLMRDAIRVGDVLDVAQRRLRLAGHARLVEHEVAAHVDDLGHVLDEHRALVHARAARGARPERLVEDRAAEQRTLLTALRRPWRRRRARSRTAGNPRQARAPHPGGGRRSPTSSRRPTAWHDSAGASGAAGAEPCTACAECVVAAKPPARFSYAWSRRSVISVLGESTLPVLYAGQCVWQRPHSVHVYRSSMSFQEKCSIAPRRSADPPRRPRSSPPRCPACRSAPLGRSFLKRTLGAAVMMCRCLL